MSKQPPLRKFKVRAGSHEQDGKVYRQGDIVPHIHDLGATFPGKFDEVDPATPPARNTTPSNSPPQPASQNPANTPEPAISGTETEKPPTDTDDDADGPENAPNVASPVGQDVTDRFPKAVEQDFKVYKREGQFFVYDVDDLSKPLGPGVKKADVDGLIANALKK